MNSKKQPRMMLSTGNIIVKTFVFLGMALFLLTLGCASSKQKKPVISPEDMNSFLQDKPPRLHPYYSKVLEEGDRNRVLNQMEAGLAAMELEKNDLAERSFEDTLLRIETVYANNETARKARSIWHEEGMKDFKGEPYERSMAYYYRGLLFLKKGDYENARACFKGGVLQDAFAEEKQHRCDFALLIFLEGWASQCLGDSDLANAAYTEVEKLRTSFTRPEASHNCLIIIETGKSPRKLADGVGHYELKFFRGKNFPDKKARLIVNGNSCDAYPMEDIAWQAMTRGGRPIDNIVQGQVNLRQTNLEIASTLSDIASTGMIAAPLFENSTGEIQAISGALGLISVTQMAISQKMKVRADTRYWKNLPDTVHIFTCKLPPGDQNITAVFLDDSGSQIPGMNKNFSILFDSKKNGFGWVRSHSALY